MSCTNPTGASVPLGTPDHAPHEAFRLAEELLENPHPEARRVVEAVLDAADAGRVYGQVVAEHAALIGCPR